jgi:hypothetical protein
VDQRARRRGNHGRLRRRQLLPGQSGAASADGRPPAHLRGAGLRAAILAATATFDDVPCSSNYAPWIYELVARNITAGCGGGNYCPTLTANRGQMATFVVKTFGLQ